LITLAWSPPWVTYWGPILQSAVTDATNLWVALLGTPILLGVSVLGIRFAKHREPLQFFRHWFRPWFRHALLVGSILWLVLTVKSFLAEPVHVHAHDQAELHKLNQEMQELSKKAVELEACQRETRRLASSLHYPPPFVPNDKREQLRRAIDELESYPVDGRLILRKVQIVWMDTPTSRAEIYANELWDAFYHWGSRADKRAGTVGKDFNEDSEGVVMLTDSGEPSPLETKVIEAFKAAGVTLQHGQEDPAPPQDTFIFKVGANRQACACGH
jgi:hypothetical protein